MTNDKYFARTVASLPFFLSVLLYPYLPAQFPMQFASDGSVNYYFPKLLALILLNGVVIYVTWLYFYRINKQPNLVIAHKGLRYLRLAIIPIISSIVLFYIALRSHYVLKFQLGDLIIGVMALLFLIVGNYLPKVGPRPMFFLPFRKKDVVGKKIWRLLGWGMVGSSLLLLLYIQFQQPLLLVGVLLLCVALPIYGILKEASTT